MIQGIDYGSRVQWLAQDGTTVLQGWCVGSVDYSMVRTGFVMVAVDPDPNGTDQLQKSVRNVVCVDIPLLTAIQPPGTPI